MANPSHAELIVIQYDDYPIAPWKNGQGVTRDIIKHELDGGGFDWRLSLADVSQSGPFSDFRDYDRTITLLDGAGFDLNFDSGVSKRLDIKHAPYDFDGGAPLYCELLGGTARDLNLMTKQGRVSARWKVLTVDQALSFEARDGVVQLIFCFEGQIQLTEQTGEQHLLKQWGTVKLGERSNLSLSGHASTRSKIFHIELI